MIKYVKLSKEQFRIEEMHRSLEKTSDENLSFDIFDIPFPEQKQRYDFELKFPNGLALCFNTSPGSVEFVKQFFRKVGRHMI